MVKHNNVLPNVHLRKHWQTNVRTWLNQAARKKSRLQARRAKAAAIAPRPLDNLRPTVSCATIRYNHRVRLGRGIFATTQDSPSTKSKPPGLAFSSPDLSVSPSITAAKTDVRKVSTETRKDLPNTLINLSSSPEMTRPPSPRPNPESSMTPPRYIPPYSGKPKSGQQRHRQLPPQIGQENQIYQQSHARQSQEKPSLQNNQTRVEQPKKRRKKTKEGLGSCRKEMINFLFK